MQSPLHPSFGHSVQVSANELPHETKPGFIIEIRIFLKRLFLIYSNLPFPGTNSRFSKQPLKVCFHGSLR